MSDYKVGMRAAIEEKNPKKTIFILNGSISNSTEFQKKILMFFFLYDFNVFIHVDFYDDVLFLKVIL